MCICFHYNEMYVAMALSCMYFYMYVCKYNCVCVHTSYTHICIYLLYVTGFMCKNQHYWHNSRTEIRLILKLCTCTLSRNTKCMAIELTRYAFTDGLLLVLSNHECALKGLWSHSSKILFILSIYV